MISFASMACEGTMYDWSGIYFRKAVRAPPKLATLGFVVYMIAMTPGRLTGDKLVNKYGIPFTFTAGLGFMLTGFGVSCVIPLVFGMAGRKRYRFLLLDHRYL